MKPEPKGVTGGKRAKNRVFCSGDDGVTLLEIMIAVAISTVVMASIYSVYNNNLKTAKAQENIVTMRQNWRAGHFVIGRELMKAGYSRSIKDARRPGFTLAQKNALSFTYVEDGTSNLVSVAFGLQGQNIMRTIDGVALPVAENIEALEFIYRLRDGSTTWFPDATELDSIRGVRVTILARSANPVRDYPHSATFALPFPDGQVENIVSPPSDDIYRQMVTGFFYCRNMADN